MQEKAATITTPEDRPFIELARPVEVTVASDEFLNFVTIGAESNVPKFSNRAQAFDWWTKTLWYDCRSALDSLIASKTRLIIYADVFRVAKDVMEDTIEFLKLFSSSSEIYLNSMTTPCYSFPKYSENLQILLYALNYIRRTGLKARIEASPLTYPINTDSSEKSEELSEDEIVDKSNWDFEDWDRHWNQKYEIDLEGYWDDEFDEEFITFRRRKRKRPAALGDGLVLPPEIIPGILPSQCPIQKGDFGFPRSIAESLAHSSLANLPEFKDVTTWTEKVQALDNCITRIHELCKSGLEEIHQLNKKQRQLTHLRRKLLSDHIQIMSLLFSFYARNKLCKFPKLSKAKHTYRWFTKHLPTFISGLKFLRCQFDREFPFCNWQQKISQQNLLTYSDKEKAESTHKTANISTHKSKS